MQYTDSQMAVTTVESDSESGVMVPIPAPPRATEGWVVVNTDEDRDADAEMREAIRASKLFSGPHTDDEEALRLAIAASEAEEAARRKAEQADLDVALALSRADEEGEEGEEGEESSDSGWSSDSETEDEDLAPRTDEEARQQAAERRRVLEAATGSTTKKQKQKPARPPRHRPRTEDAYDRYVRMTKEVSLRPIAPPPPPPVAGPQAGVERPTSPPASASKGRLLATLKHMSRAIERDRRASPSPSPGERRTISGPVQESTSASWTAIVGPDALRGMDERERKRQEAIFELIASEGAHVRDLQIVVEVRVLPPLLPPYLSVSACTVQC